MAEDRRDWPPADLSELGEVNETIEVCPGVYYVGLQHYNDATPPRSEYLLVLKDAPISAAARRLGQPLKNGQGLVYPLGDDSGPSKAVQYEVLKYKVANGIPLPEGETLRSCAAHGAEDCPEYFGLIPAPMVTPWGRTLRYKMLDNGVYWVETDQLVEGLAVAYPAWSADLTDETIEFAQTIQGDSDEESYRFFEKEDSSTALFELLTIKDWWNGLDMLNLPAIIKSMKERFPEYVFNLPLMSMQYAFDLAVKNCEQQSDQVDNDTDFVNW